MEKMTIRKEIRDERSDVLGFYKSVKKLNEAQTEIIEVEEQFKETTLAQLKQENDAIPQQIIDLQTQIEKLQAQQLELSEMLTLANTLK